MASPDIGVRIQPSDKPAEMFLVVPMPGGAQMRLPLSADRATELMFAIGHELHAKAPPSTPNPDLFELPKILETSDVSFKVASTPDGTVWLAVKPQGLPVLRFKMTGDGALMLGDALREQVVSAEQSPAKPN